MPVVFPLKNPLSMVKLSGSFRGVASLLLPGARRFISFSMAARSSSTPAGRPSMTTPMEGP